MCHYNLKNLAKIWKERNKKWGKISKLLSLHPKPNRNKFLSWVNVVLTADQDF